LKEGIEMNLLYGLFACEGFFSDCLSKLCVEERRTSAGAGEEKEECPVCIVQCQSIRFLSRYISKKV